MLARVTQKGVGGEEVKTPGAGEGINIHWVGMFRKHS